jgi:arylsulfatase A
MTTFHETWIPIIKAGGFKRFELYDLVADPKQTKDISRQRPEITARLKETLLALHKSVMADAPDWQPLDRKE